MRWRGMCVSIAMDLLPERQLLLEPRQVRSALRFVRHRLRRWSSVLRRDLQGHHVGREELRLVHRCMRNGQGLLPRCLRGEGHLPLNQGKQSKNFPSCAQRWRLPTLVATAQQR